MNSRDRFLATMAFEPVDRAPLWEYGYWGTTLRRWYQEGLPRRVGLPDDPGLLNVNGPGCPWDPTMLPYTALDHDVQVELSLDKGIRRIPLNSFVYPPFERRILEDRGDTVLVRDPRGHIRLDRKDGQSISDIVKTAVETRDDWERFKAERLQPTLEGRLPADWPQQREQLRQRDFPLAIGGFGGQVGFFHTTRYLLGPVRILYSFYDQPDLVKDIMNYLADFWVSLFDQILSQIDADFAFFNEDMAYKNGPFISPATFREFLLPCYKKLCGLLRDHGIKIILVDSDGDNWKLIPLLVEGGATGLWPLEVAANMDASELRKAFPRLHMIGGVDKRAVATGKEAIDQELEGKIPQTLSSGGFIPTIDHLTPPDVSWENFKYYRRRLAEMTYACPPSSAPLALSGPRGSVKHDAGQGGTE